MVTIRSLTAAQLILLSQERPIRQQLRIKKPNKALHMSSKAPLNVYARFKLRFYARGRDSMFKLPANQVIFFLSEILEKLLFKIKKFFFEKRNLCSIS